MVPPRLTLVSNNARERDATAENSDSEAVHDAAAHASLSDPEAAVDHLSKSVLREKLRRLEALLFASAEPLDAKALTSCLEPEDDVNALLAELQSDYKDRGVVLVRVAGRWQFRTAEDLSYLLERQQILVQERPDGLRVPERRRPADREPGGGPGLLGVRAPGLRGARQGREATHVHAVGPARERQDGFAVRDEHQRLHDLPDLAPDRSSRVGGGLRPLREPTHVHRMPEHRGGVEEPLDRLAHAGNDTGSMAPGTIRPPHDYGLTTTIVPGGANR